MPLVKDGEPFPLIVPAYTSHFGENGQLLSIERDKVGGMIGA